MPLKKQEFTLSPKVVFRRFFQNSKKNRVFRLIFKKKFQKLKEHSKNSVKLFEIARYNQGMFWPSKTMSLLEKDSASLLRPKN